MVLCVWLIMCTFVSIITVYKPKNRAASGLNAVPVSNAGVCGDLCLRHTPVTDKQDKPVCTRTMFLIPVFYRMFPAPQVPCLSTVYTKTHTNTCALNKSPQTVARKSRIDLDTTTVSSEICFFFRKMLLRDAFKRFQAVHLVFQRNKH